jgi:hypothetical protein
MASCIGVREVLSIASCAVVLGCVGDMRDSRGAASVDTLSSGVIRVQGPSEGLWDETSAWSLQERLRLGSVNQEGPELFGEAWDVELDQLGRVYVLDRLAKAVRVFDREGEFVRSLGREGEGPGEFANPFGLAWDRDGDLWVVDVHLGRYSVFDTAGAHLREYRRAVGGYSWPWPGRFDRGGVLYEASLTGTGRDALVGFLPGEDLTPVDSFPDALVIPEGSDFWNLQDERGIGAIVSIPFGRKAMWALDERANLWVGHSGTYSVAKRNLQGDTLLLLERPVEPIPVSAAEHDSVVEGLGRYATHPKMDLSRIPTTKPFFQSLIPDDAGNLWVLRQGPGESWFFDVFAGDGAYLGRVDLPVIPSLFPPPTIRGAEMLVVTLDELGVQYVVLYDIASS